MRTFTEIPLDVEEMIQWLNELYPERCADPEDTEREIWMKVGERRVVRSLTAKLTYMNEKGMKEFK
jgi:hypothetical protein